MQLFAKMELQGIHPKLRLQACRVVGVSDNLFQPHFFRAEST